MITNFNAPYGVILSVMLLSFCCNEMLIVSQSASQSAIQKSCKKIHKNATTKVEYSQNITLVVSVAYRGSD